MELYARVRRGHPSCARESTILRWRSRAANGIINSLQVRGEQAGLVLAPKPDAPEIRIPVLAEPAKSGSMNGSYLFELVVQPGGPEGRPLTTAGSKPITKPGRPRDVQPSSPRLVKVHFTPRPMPGEPIVNRRPSSGNRARPLQDPNLRPTPSSCPVRWIRQSSDADANCGIGALDEPEREFDDEPGDQFGGGLRCIRQSDADRCVAHVFIRRDEPAEGNRQLSVNLRGE